MSYKTGFYWRRNGMAGAFAFERFDSGCFQPPTHREACFLSGFGKCRSERNRKVQYDGKIKGNGTKCMIIGARNSVTGNIEGASPICINGKLIGNINSTSNVYISKTGSVEGSVTADHLVLLGNITGDRINAGKLVVTVTGVVNSDVKVAKLTVEEGGVLNGQVSVNGSHTPAEDEI